MIITTSLFIVVSYSCGYLPLFTTKPPRDSQIKFYFSSQRSRLCPDCGLIVLAVSRQRPRPGAEGPWGPSVLPGRPSRLFFGKVVKEVTFRLRK